MWFTSDTHFGHAKILQLSDRPWATIEAMHESLIDNWNACVGKRDLVFHLGDFGSGNEEAMRAVFSRLNGIKHLVIGNHDKGPVLKQRWVSRKHYHVQKWQGITFVLCHFPLEAWWHAENGKTLHCHGHVHGSVVPKVPHRWDVGVDPMGFRPVHARELFAEALSQDFDRRRYLI